MKKIKKIEASKLYLFKSTASANSVYFETDDMIKLFLKYFNYYLKDFVKIHELSLNKDGWAIILKTKTEVTIRKHFILKSKSNVKNGRKDIWRIISERIRVFISTYVRVSNKLLGREGTLVRKSFERYEFESEVELKEYIESMHLNEVDLSQEKQKYRGLSKHFRVSKAFVKHLNSKILKTCTPKHFIAEKTKIYGSRLSIIRMSI